MSRVNPCLVAVLHVFGLVVIWAAVYLICRASAGLTCVLALAAGGIISIFVVASFFKFLNQCLASRR